MTDLELQRAQAPARLHPLTALASIGHIGMFVFVLLSAFVAGFVSYAVFETRTNLRLDTIELRIGKIEGGVDRISDALHINRPHLAADESAR